MSAHLDLSVLDRAKAKVAGLEAAAREYAEILSDGDQGNLAKALVTGLAIQTMRNILDQQTMQLFLPLCGSPLGFFSDRPSERNKTPYSPEDLREILIAALLQGVFPWGREFGVIGGNLMIMKEGWKRKVRELPGVTEAKVIPGRIIVEKDRTYCVVAGSWKVGGKKFQLLNSKDEPGRPFEIPVHSSTGVDAILGKAERRGWKAIWEEITQGRLLEEEDADLGPLPEQPAVERMANLPALPPSLPGSASQRLANDLRPGPGRD